MSDTTAFVAGCAITGIAAFLLLRGELGLGQTRPLQPTQAAATAPQLPISNPVPQPPSLVTDYGRESQMQRDLEEQKSITDDLEEQLKDQQKETEELKSQLTLQQANTEKLLNQLQEQQRVAMSVPQPLRSMEVSDQPNRFQNLVFLAFGTMLLVVGLGAGAILIIIIVFMVQSGRRSPRIMHVVHPASQPYAPPPYQSYNLLEQGTLPPQPRTRRTSQVNYYDGQ